MAEEPDRDFGGYITFDSAGLERPGPFDPAEQGGPPKLFALGRHCLEAVCRAARPGRLFLPTFTCESVKKVAARLGADVSYYSISESFVPQVDALRQGDLLVLNNYFGLSASSAPVLAWLREAGPRLCVIDDTQSIGIRNQFPGFASFLSPRKFLPLTDGGILFDPNGSVAEADMPQRQDMSWNRIEWLARAVDEQGRNPSYAAYADFRKGLQDLEYMRMSAVTRSLLAVFDVGVAIRQRNINFNRLRTELPIAPCFDGHALRTEMFAPIGYPVFVADARDAQRQLSRQRIYAIRYWPDLDTDPRTSPFERTLLRHLLIVPINAAASEAQLSALKAIVNRA
jgi:hypothetical protein